MSDEGAAPGPLRRLHGALMPDYNRKAALYWWIVLALGALAIGAGTRAVLRLPFESQLLVLAGCAVSMIVGLFPIQLPGAKSSFSAGEIFVFLLLLMVGPGAACLAAAGEAFVASFRTSSRWTSRLVSPAAAAVSMWVIGTLLEGSIDGLRARGLYSESALIGLVTLSAGAYFLLTSWQIRLVIHLKRGEPLRIAELLGSFGWVGTTYCANAFVACLLYLTARQAGAVVLLTAGPLIALLLAAVHFHLRQRETEAAQARARVEAAERETALAASHMLELRRIADHDGLTSLANRRRFLECLNDRLVRWQLDPSRPFAVMYLDFDRFKLINDTLGHAAGDEFLVHVSKRIQHQVRHGDLVGRLGGDEFAVLVDNFGTEDQVIALADRLQDALRRPYKVVGHEVVSSASIGITFSRFAYAAADAMLRDADRAMYEAKSLGRARHAVHQP